MLNLVIILIFSLLSKIILTNAFVTRKPFLILINRNAITIAVRIQDERFLETAFFAFHALADGLDITDPTSSIFNVVPNTKIILHHKCPSPLSSKIIV